MNRSRLIVGLILIAAAVLLYFFTDLNTGSVIAIGVIGMVSIVISRKKRSS